MSQLMPTDQDFITEVVIEPLTWFCHRCFSVAEPPVFIRQETLMRVVCVRREEGGVIYLLA